VAATSPPPDTESRRSRWAGLVPAVERVVAPFAAGTGLTLGGTLFGAAMERLPVSGPDFLLVLGASALAGGATLWGSRRGAGRSAKLPVGRSPAPGTIVCIRCSTSVPAHEWAEIVRRAWHTAGTGGRLHSDGARALGGLPGDRLWGQWLPDEASHLPVGLVGPVPETAWIPPTVGSVVPFPDREPRQVVVGGTLVPVDFPGFVDDPFEPEVSTTTEPFVPSDFAPAVETTSVFSNDAGSDRSGTSTTPGTFEPEISSDWITVEALHPLPPHLRAGHRPGESSGPPGRPSGPRASPPARSCATCSRALPPAVRSRPCPDCRLPVCLTCRTQAVVNYGQTWCGRCATNHRWEDPPPTGRWAGAASSSSSSSSGIASPTPDS
jgi:hypothetical protein